MTLFLKGAIFIKRDELFSENSFTPYPLLWFPPASNGHSQTYFMGFFGGHKKIMNMNACDTVMEVIGMF